MSKVFIDHFHCKTPCEIFTGKNALLHALFWIDTGRICSNPDIFYQHKWKLDVAVSWKECKSKQPANKEIMANGVHMKMYEYKDYIIFGSQNNGSSPLFESALVFKKKQKLLDFARKSFARALQYSNWWKFNQRY